MIGEEDRIYGAEGQEVEPYCQLDCVGQIVKIWRP